MDPRRPLVVAKLVQHLLGVIYRMFPLVWSLQRRRVWATKVNKLSNRLKQSSLGISVISLLASPNVEEVNIPRGV